jgi:hypothetical protein
VGDRGNRLVGGGSGRDPSETGVRSIRFEAEEDESIRLPMDVLDRGGDRLAQGRFVIDHMIRRQHHHGGIRIARQHLHQRQ